MNVETSSDDPDADTHLLHRESEGITIVALIADMTPGGAMKGTTIRIREERSAAKSKKKSRNQSLPLSSNLNPRAK